MEPCTGHATVTQGIYGIAGYYSDIEPHGYHASANVSFVVGGTSGTTDRGGHFHAELPVGDADLSFGGAVLALTITAGAVIEIDYIPIPAASLRIGPTVVGPMDIATCE